MKTLKMFAIVLCIMLMLASNAFAFGKRCGGGLFSKRSQSTTVQYAGTTTSGCVQGPTQNHITQAGQSVPTDCPNGKCVIPQARANTPVYTSQTIGPAWAPPAWKVVK